MAVGSDGWAGAGAGSGEAASGRAFPHGRPRLPPAAGWRSSMVGGLRPPATDPKFVFPTPPWGTDIPPPPRGGMAKGCGRRGGGGRHCGPGLGSGTSLGWGEFWGVCVPHPRVSGWGLECPLLRCVRLCGGTGGNGALLGVPLGLGLCGWGVSLGSRGGSFASPPGLVPNVDILGGTQLPLHPQNTPSSACSWRG